MPEEKTPETAETFVPTKAEDYPVDRDMEVTLPSGAKVVLHRPNKYALMKAGRFPKDVEAAVRQAAEEGVAPDFEVRMKALDYLLCETFVDPKLHITPKKGYVSVHALPDPDREFVIFLLGLSVF
jgi:hypothetical protein